MEHSVGRKGSPAEEEMAKSPCCGQTVQDQGLGESGGSSAMAFQHSASVRRGSM